MTYEEIEEQFPEEFELRKNDKLAYRYPRWCYAEMCVVMCVLRMYSESDNVLSCSHRGESYLDVIARLEPIIIEMERHREPLLIIGHQVAHVSPAWPLCRI